MTKTLPTDAAAAAGDGLAARQPQDNRDRAQAVLATAPELRSIRASRAELLTAVSGLSAFVLALAIVIGIRIFHMASNTGTGGFFSMMIAVLFALAIVLGLALLARKHSRGNRLGDHLPALRDAVQETQEIGQELTASVQGDLQESKVLDEEARKALVVADETFTKEFHQHIAGLQGAAQVLGLEHLPTPSKADLVIMAQPLRADVLPRLAAAQTRRDNLAGRLEAINLPLPQAPGSPHTHAHPVHPHQPDVHWVDPSVLPDGYTPAGGR